MRELTINLTAKAMHFLATIIISSRLLVNFMQLLQVWQKLQMLWELRTPFQSQM